MIYVLQIINHQTMNNNDNNDCYTCYNCDRIIYDNGWSPFEIYNINYLNTVKCYICEDCNVGFKKMLQPNPMSFYCFIEDKKGHRQIFENMFSLEKWLKDKSINDYKLGVYTLQHWNKIHQSAFIGKGKCGGMSYDDVFKLGKEIITSGFKSKKACISWRHNVALMLKVTVSSPEQLINDIKNHEIKNNLSNVPFNAIQLDAYYGKFNSPCMLMYFTSPDNNKNIKWVNNIGDIKATIKANYDFNELNENSDYIWNIDDEFIKYRREKINAKISVLNSELIALNKYK